MSARFLIDTDIFIHIRQHRTPQLRERFEKLRIGEAVISAIVYGELLYGAKKSATPDKAAKAIEEIVAVIPVEPLTASVSTQYGELRAALEKKGEVIGNNDLWIAAHARALGLTLISANEREFKRVPNLKVQNWAV